MKSLSLFCLVASMFVVGCSEPTATSVTDGATKSDVEKYNQMLKESQDQMLESEAQQAVVGPNAGKPSGE